MPQRPTADLALTLPRDVVESMALIAKNQGLPDVPALIRRYISQGLRAEEARPLV